MDLSVDNKVWVVDNTEVAHNNFFYLDDVVEVRDMDIVEFHTVRKDVEFHLDQTKDLVGDEEVDEVQDGAGNTVAAVKEDNIFVLYKVAGAVADNNTEVGNMAGVNMAVGNTAVLGADKRF